MQDNTESGSQQYEIKVAGKPRVDTAPYGDPSNSTRPGGVEMRAVYTSNRSNTTLHIISDNAMVTSLIASIDQYNSTGKGDCWDMLTLNSRGPYRFNGNGTDPRPEEAVQYYRASSVVLTLDGYNNTAALAGDANAKPVSLPTNVDMDLVRCVNGTIGKNVLLFGSASGLSPPGMTGRAVVVFVYALWCLFPLI